MAISALVSSFNYDWQRCRKYIVNAVEHQDLYSIEDIEVKIADGTFQFWPGIQSAFVTEISRFPQKTVLNLLFCGGDYKELEAMLPYIEEFGKRCGATQIFGGGRPGWKRKLKHLGFKSEHLISKDL